jgi:hypothetical protein
MSDDELLERANEVAGLDGALRWLLDHRGGCRCPEGFPPCSACCDPITLSEAREMADQFPESFEVAPPTCKAIQCMRVSADGKEVYPSLVDRRGRMCCPECGRSYGEALLPPNDPMKAVRDFCG